MEYSIAVGIDEYKDSNINKSSYSENDAKKYSSIMEKQFELQENILLLGNKATKREVEYSINNLAVNEGDRVFFFFAGHGQNIYDEPRLCCYDSTENAMTNPETWINVKWIMGIFATKKVNLICFIDACYSSIGYSPRGLDTPSKMSSDIYNSDSYIYVFAAANNDEKANGDRRLQHGIWSTYLFEALQGNREALINNKLTSNSLQNYLYKEVQQYYISEGDQPEQKPQVWGKTEGEFIIKDFSLNEIKLNQILITDIYFGTVDADNEIRENPDKFIENYFDLNDVSEELFNKNNIQFVVGRKGTGKTYIGKYMERTRGENIKYISLDSFDYKSFTFLANKGNGYEPYVLPWKYFILANMLVYINNSLNSSDITSVIKELYGRKASMQQILHKKFKRGISIRNKVLESQWKEDLAKDDDLFDLKDITQMFSLIISDYGKNKYLLILDGLDEKINENEHYKDIMNGLIWAIKDINTEMYDNQMKIKVAAFFRKDVFEFVQGANTAKIDSGSTITLDWVTDSDDKKKYPLYQFMNIRYQNCLQDFGIDKDDHEISEILPDTMKLGNSYVDTWSWLLNFTTYKPRDVVKMLSECRKKCKNKENKLTSEIIWEAQPEYSRYLMKELKNELYGFIDEDMINSIFNRLQLMHTSWREYTFIKTIINKSAVELGRNISDDEVKNIISRFYEAGVFGIMLSNEHEHWSYRRNIKISEYIETSKYKLHQGLWKGLSIW